MDTDLLSSDVAVDFKFESNSPLRLQLSRYETARVL
jgi:hypothetical protein